MSVAVHPVYFLFCFLTGTQSLKVSELSVSQKSFVLVSCNIKWSSERQGLSNSASSHSGIHNYEFWGQLSRSFLQDQQFSATFLPIEPIDVWGCAGYFSMVVLLGLPEVCC